MITDLWLDFLHGLATTLSSWLNSAIPSPPSFWTDAASAITTAFALVPGPVRYFVPIAPTLAAAAAVFGLMVALGALRLARRVLSLFTGGGGMA